MLHLRVLGALDATLDTDGAVTRPDLGGPRQRSVLSLLLVARGEVVSVDRLVEDLWNGEAPPRAIGALQAYVSHLRRGLEPDRAPRTPATVLVSEPPGYAIRLPADSVDAWRFETMVRQAGEPGQDARTRRILEQALALWRGPAYAEFRTEAWAVNEADRLEGLRIVARERWCEAVLRDGDADEAVLAAEVLAREFPLREEGWRLLAMGLYASGRQADALAALRRARDILADELGLDPGPALLQVEADVLAQRLAVPTPVRAAPPVAPAPADRTRPPDRSRPAADERRPDHPFVGREPELNALHTAAAQVTGRSDRRVVLIAGEAGAGKSSLVERFSSELRGDGWRLVIGRCPESEGAPPAWAWVEAVRSLATEVDPGPLTAALAPLLDEAAQASADTDASFGRFLLGRAVTGYLAAAAGSAPIAVVLDDLHRADSETLALLDTVAAETTGSPVLLVAAYRPNETSAGLRNTLAGLAAAAPTRLHLPGLDATQSARLIRAVSGTQPDGATLDALVERTAGNPFYLAESARLLGSEGRLVAVSKVPEGVRDVLRRRFARLPELSVSVLRLAAVVGRDADIDVLVQAAEVDEDAVLEALEAGVLAGLLTEPTPGAVRFAHLLVRDTLYEDLPRLRRSRWHGRIADAIRTVRPDDVAALAHHYHRAATVATARPAVDAAVRAADVAVARYAHETAAELYAQALADLDRVSTGGGEPDARLAERVDLLARLSRSQLAAGASVAALSARRQAMRLAAAGNRDDLLIHVITRMALPTPWMTRPYGTIDHELIALIERALAAAGPPHDPTSRATRVQLLHALAIELTDRARSEATAGEAEALARVDGDPTLIGLALHAWSACLYADLDEPRFRAVGAELVELGRRPNLAVFELLGHGCLARTAAVHGEHEAMTRHVDRMRELVRRYRWRQAGMFELMLRGGSAHLAGRMADAEFAYAKAGELLEASGALDSLGILLLAQLSVRVTQGRAAELLEMVAGIDTAADALLADLIALPLLAAGRRDEAARGRDTLPPVTMDFFRGMVLAMRGMIAAQLGDPVEAAAVEAELVRYRGQIAGGGTGSFIMGPVDTVLGDLAATLGRTRDAEELYRAALELARRCGNEWWVRQAADRLAGVGVARRPVRDLPDRAESG